MEENKPLNRICTNAVNFNLYTQAFNHPAMSVREFKTVSNSGFLTVDSGLQIPDFGFQSIAGFQIPWAVFRIPKPRIPDSKRKSFPRIQAMKEMNIKRICF